MHEESPERLWYFLRRTPDEHLRAKPSPREGLTQKTVRR
tara:strand:+ start:2910 stop:3026 length:117 start_codon:yes stop_codon:yes gene_type:complete